MELAPCSEEADAHVEADERAEAKTPPPPETPPPAAAFEAEPGSPNGNRMKKDHVQVWVQGPDGYAKPLSAFKYNAPDLAPLIQTEPNSPVLMDDDQDVAPRAMEDAVDSKSEEHEKKKKDEEANKMKIYPQPPLPKPSVSPSLDFTKLTVEQRKQLWATMAHDGPARGTVISPPPKGVQGISI